MTKFENVGGSRETPSGPGHLPLHFSSTLHPQPQPHPALPFCTQVPGPAPGGRSQSEASPPPAVTCPAPQPAGFRAPEEAPAPKGVTGQTRALRFASGAGWLREATAEVARAAGPTALGPGVTAGRRDQWEIALAGIQSLLTLESVAVPWRSLCACARDAVADWIPAFSSAREC